MPGTAFPTRAHKVGMNVDCQVQILAMANVDFEMRVWNLNRVSGVRLISECLMSTNFWP